LLISLIVAVAENGVIGRDGGLPWQISADLKHFKTLTMGKPMIMGRKTFDSIGKPLPGRTSIVITRRKDFAPDGVIVANAWPAALEAAAKTLKESDQQEVMVIGGAEIYALAMSGAKRLYVTEVHEVVEGDTVFPEIDKNRWQEIRREKHAPDNPAEPSFSFVTYEQKV